MLMQTKAKRVTMILAVVLLIVFAVFSLLVQTSRLNVTSFGQTFTVPCTISTSGNAWEGNLTFGLLHYDSANSSRVLQSYLVNMQTNGQLLNLRQANDPSGDYFEEKYISQNTLLFEGEPGLATHFWDLNTNQTVDFPNLRNYHHDICYNPVNGNFLVLRNYYRNVNGSYVLYDTIEEDNASGAALWVWDTYDHFPLSWADKFNNTVKYNNTTALDFTHCNAIMWDYQENVTYLNSRHLDAFYKINMTTGNVIWGCGRNGNFTLLSANGTVVSSLWYHSHATQEIAPNMFIMFDNDYQNETNPNDAHSRILMLSVDETSMIAREIWSWEAPVDYWSPFWGKADVLPNGDRIGTFGTPTKTYNDTIGAVIVEVNVQGQIVRSWTFPKYWGIYRVLVGGLVANEFGIYPQPTVIPEFSLPLMITPIMIIATTVAAIKFQKRSRRF
jgi:hypothetical protein